MRKRYPRRLGEPYPPRPCEWCRSDFTPPRRDSRFCCDEHSRVYARNQRRIIEAKNAKSPSCEKCGGEIVQAVRGRTRKYCTNCAPREYVKAKLDNLVCETCGKSFSSSRKRGPIPRYCSDTCRHRPYQDRQRLPDERDCAQCGSTFSRAERGRQAKWCSDECKLASKRKGYPITNCETCGVELVSGSSQPMRFCDEHRTPDSAYCKRRRERIKDGEAIDNLAVFERDNWTCGVCGDPVDPALRFPHPMAASLDHIKPLALGGRHIHENVQCAHWICNCQKAAKAA